jgi:hypothetical protein
VRCADTGYRLVPTIRVLPVHAIPWRLMSDGISAQTAVGSLGRFREVFGELDGR